ncbi:hypothetical protein ACFQZR_09705 [Paenibacillus sp. GCM10027629]|uniref:hypothetical protein n=1 Tax=Paenibacillus sp. GCM10027629 TaxID=3273414 RepID=UPI00363A1097
MNKKKKLIAVCFSVIVVSGVLATTIFANNAMFTPQKKMSSQEIANVLNSVESINTKYGVFERTAASNKQFNSSEIVYNEDDITDSTRQVITDYGTFIKK